MLQELLSLVETLDFEEDAGIIVVSATWREDQENLELGLEVHREEGEVQRWTLCCTSVREHHIVMGWGDNLVVANDHVLLWPHTKTIHKLWFNGRGQETSATIGALWRAHHQLVGRWLSFSRFLNGSDDFADLVEGGYGKLAEGPEPLIKAYEQVLETCGIKASTTTHPPLHWDGSMWVKPGELVALCVGQCYVVASRVEARQH